jgi:hypothetical protein
MVMAHHTAKSGYVQLVDRLNRFLQGSSPSELLYKILELLRVLLRDHDCHSKIRDSASGSHHQFYLRDSR